MQKITAQLLGDLLKTYDQLDEMLDGFLDSAKGTQEESDRSMSLYKQTLEARRALATFGKPAEAGSST